MLGRVMYLRPGNLWKEFVLEPKAGSNLDSRGRVRAVQEKENPILLRGILSSATPEQKIQGKQLQHTISHVITQKGAPLGKEEDKLILGDRVFYIQGLDHVSGLGIYTLYYVEERYDLNE